MEVERRQKQYDVDLLSQELAQLHLLLAMAQTLQTYQRQEYQRQVVRLQAMLGFLVVLVLQLLMLVVILGLQMEIGQERTLPKYNITQTIYIFKVVQMVFSLDQAEGLTDG